MSWLFLSAAIVSEVGGTLALRMVSHGRGRTPWVITLIVAYLAAFGFLTLTLADGMALGVAYGIWAASGVALTALASRVLFGEPLTKVMVLGVALIAAGVLLIELGAAH
ncbi:DMT family transporter [Nonomuraea sp. NPDC050328]|uniref:DMT family transporter n=1 Tax=Nonomuraea sp. NPDC050328 TaxID=3364361 RepID=UPI0037AE6C4B